MHIRRCSCEAAPAVYIWVASPSKARYVPRRDLVLHFFACRARRDAAAAARSGDRLLVIATRSGRLDHMLATVPLLAAAPYDDYERDAWVDDDTLHVVRGLRRLTLQPGATMSVLPIHGDAVVTLRGVRWELSSQRLSAGTSLGVSNVVEQPRVTIDVVEGTALVVVPRPEHDEEPEEVR